MFFQYGHSIEVNTEHQATVKIWYTHSKFRNIFQYLDLQMLKIRGFISFTICFINW